jgi:hypothetical protein
MNSETSDWKTKNKKQKFETQGTFREYGQYLTMGIQLAAAVVVFFFLVIGLTINMGFHP